MKRDLIDSASRDPAYLRQRASPHDRALNLSTTAWLKELPPEIVPVALASQFPRIVNRLSRFWDSPRMMKQCFEELLVHRRSRREGFPEDALRELFALEQYYHESHKTDETESDARF